MADTRIFTRADGGKGTVFRRGVRERVIAAYRHDLTAPEIATIVDEEVIYVRQTLRKAGLHPKAGKMGGARPGSGRKRTRPPKPPSTRRHTHWTDEMDGVLRSMREARYTYRACARHMKTTLGAIAGRCARIGA